MIDETGLFTAGHTAATFRVEAKSVAVPEAPPGDAMVTVHVIHISVTPASATVSPGGQVQFTATVTGYTGTITWSLPDGGGSIPQTGLFTAGATRGVFTVRATGDDSGEHADASVRVCVNQSAVASVNDAGDQGDASSSNPSISPDGSFVTFDSRASNL